MASGLDSTKTAARPSHEAIENKGNTTNKAGETPMERIDQDAMEGAKRAQNRIHANEEQIPGSTIFSK
jgi:hypothetical protein